MSVYVCFVSFRTSSICLCNGQDIYKRWHTHKDMKEKVECKYMEISRMDDRERQYGCNNGFVHVVYCQDADE